jgi:hypothetical protein
MYKIPETANIYLITDKRKQQIQDQLRTMPTRMDLADQKDAEEEKRVRPRRDFIMALGAIVGSAVVGYIAGIGQRPTMEDQALTQKDTDLSKEVAARTTDHVSTEKVATLQSSIFSPPRPSPTPIVTPIELRNQPSTGTYVGPANLSPQDYDKLSPVDQEKYEKLKTPTTKP